MEALLAHPLEIRPLGLAVQLEWLLELLAGRGGHVVDVPPALVRHHLHLGHHADAAPVLQVGDGDVGAGVDQLTRQRQEHKRNILRQISGDKTGDLALRYCVDTRGHVISVRGPLRVTLTRARVSGHVAVIRGQGGCHGSWT